ncbi:MAG: hypothetical protein GY870_10025 [archaeon]|nr:hypothetical protein [archaeon]
MATGSDSQDHPIFQQKEEILKEFSNNEEFLLRKIEDLRVAARDIKDYKTLRRVKAEIKILIEKIEKIAPDIKKYKFRLI